MLYQRAANTFLWITALQAAFVQSDDYEQEVEKCYNETQAFLANATGLSETYPSNATCSFLNDTYCALDLSSSTFDYIQLCYEFGGFVTLFTSTAECDWTRNNATTLLASISNDPVCSASACFFGQVNYDVSERYRALLNATALDARCFLYGHSPVQLTTLSGVCAAETLRLQATLPQVIAPNEKCNTKTCSKNYTSSAEVYFRMCRGNGGNPFRQSERMATCQDFSGTTFTETVITEFNVPACYSALCSADVLIEEESFVNQQWTSRIGPDFSTCTFTFESWKAVNASSSNGGKNETSSGFRRFHGIAQGTTLLLVPSLWMALGLAIS